MLGGHLIGGRIAARNVHGKLVLVDGRPSRSARHRRRLGAELHIHQSIIQIGRTLAAERDAAAAAAVRMTVAAGPVRRRLRAHGSVTGGSGGSGKGKQCHHQQQRECGRGHRSERHTRTSSMV